MASKIIKICLLAFCVFLGGEAREIRAQQMSPLVRVSIFKEVPEFNLTITGRFKLLNVPADLVLWEGSVLREVKVIAVKGGFKLGTERFSDPHVKILPYKEASLYINGRRFRGEIDILRNPKTDTLTVINSVDLENYIKGVMYHEVSHFWPMESLKAQAVAARTYALFQMEANKTKDYDVTNDIYSQVYGGRGSEQLRTNIAVDRTAGVVLTYKGNLLPAYFHATCAGQTESASELWNHDIPPLRGVYCFFCMNSPHYGWKKNLRLKDIQDKLKENGYDIASIKNMAVMERNQSGRIKTLEITSRDNKKIRVSGKDFREMIGPNVIRSNNYEIIMRDYYVDLVGKGWGHGVGLCQWGAREMARQGHSYEDILKFYYPGVDITVIKIK